VLKKKQTSQKGRGNQHVFGSLSLFFTVLKMWLIDGVSINILQLNLDGFFNLGIKAFYFSFT